MNKLILIFLIFINTFLILNQYNKYFNFIIFIDKIDYSLIYPDNSQDNQKTTVIPYIKYVSNNFKINEKIKIINEQNTLIYAYRQHIKCVKYPKQQSPYLKSNY